MIPSIKPFIQEEFTFQDEPTHTYKMDILKCTVSGYSDGLEAMKQTIHKILCTERFQYLIYSGNYGLELIDLYGQPVSYVCPELERRITEALLWDDRIQSVDDFQFHLPNKGEICVIFTVHTIFGDVRSEKAVNLNV